MRQFKEILRREARDVFMNPAEFAEERLVNGLPMLTLWDDTLQPQGTNSVTDPSGWGVVSHLAVLYLLDEAFPCPLSGEALTVDGERYTVVRATPQEGLLRLDLEGRTA
ncbi:hypothetical protein [Megalodesulfovibrio paquesii]